MQEPVDTSQFLTSFKGFMDQANAQAPVKEPIFGRYLREHFGTDPKDLPVVSESFDKSDHPNLHLALAHQFEQGNWSVKILGISSTQDYHGVKIAHLLGKERGTQVSEGPVEYTNIALHDGKMLACVRSGLYLITHGEQQLALLIWTLRDIFSPSRGDVVVEVMGSEQKVAEALLRDIRTTIRTHNIYRSHIISLHAAAHGPSVDVQFHHLPQIGPGEIILPPGILERIERQTIGFARLSAKLRHAQRHIKRGILLYGPPGTGKTLTAMYIAGQMPERTVILITGRSAGLIEQSCKMARLLQPATIILEDVDLIAEERTQQASGCTVLLFELLNQMDGLAEDADILFLLTTNRPDILEPALVARPGRIDQAIEIPLPDHACRQRLFDLYSQGLTLKLQERDRIIDQTAGVSATFIRELLRKAALFAADEQQELEDIIVEDSHIDAALRELVLEGGELTKRLLGAGHAV